MANFQIILIVATCVAGGVSGHGRLMKPPGRSSVFRIPEFDKYDPPKNYGDNQLYCGGVHQKDNPGTNCGVCGDPLSASRPRPNENGGTYARGIITGKYQAGQVIDVEVELTKAHLGYMEWRLCTNLQDETQTCFNKHVLRLANGSGTKVAADKGDGWYKAQLKLPEGVRCNHCIIQWNYRAGNNWGHCEDGSSGIGCGPQETFRGCADVSIS